MTIETEKVDFKKTEKKFYYPKKVEAIMVPEMTYLTVSGAGEPAGETFQKAIDACIVKSKNICPIDEQQPP